MLGISFRCCLAASEPDSSVSEPRQLLQQQLQPQVVFAYTSDETRQMLNFLAVEQLSGARLGADQERPRQGKAFS